jgi:hypothetical protein
MRKGKILSEREPRAVSVLSEELGKSLVPAKNHA